MDAIRLLTPPVSEPVTLEQARNFVRVDGDDDDALLRGRITAARQEAEAVTGRVLGDSAWAVAVPPLSGPFEVPLVPCTALTAVEAEGMAVAPGLYAFAPSGLSPQESPLRAVFTPGLDFPQGETLLTVRAGYPVDRFPEPIRQWMLVRIGTLYEQRESFAVGSNFNEFGRSFVDCLLDPYVVAGGF